MQRYNFQFTGQRAFLIEDGKLAGPGEGLRVSGHDHRLLGRDGGGRRPADLRARRRLQLRQGPARAGRAGQPRRAVRAVPGRPDPQHGAGGRTSDAAAALATPQQLVERALELSRADGAVVLVDAATDANLRWANNTLTTNGVAAGRTVTVISTVERRGRRRLGGRVVARSGVDLDTVEDLVRASEQAARDAGPAEDAPPLVEPATPAARLGRGPGADLDRRCSPRSPRRSARPSGGRARPGSCCSASPSTRIVTHVSGDLHRAAAAARPAHRRGGAQRQVPRLRPLGLGRRADRGTSPTWTWRRSAAELGAAAGLAAAPDRSARGPLRDAAAAVRGRRSDGLRVLDARRPGRGRRAAPCSPRRAAGPRRRRAGSPALPG